MRKLIRGIYGYFADLSAKRIEFNEVPKSDIVCKEFRFYGKVQNVGFRRTAKIWADKLGLFGYGENLEDGSVFLLLQGETNKIQLLISAFDKINRIKISKIEEKSLEINNSLTEFKA